MRKKIVFCVLTSLALIGCGKDIKTDGIIEIVPKPEQITSSEGALALNKSTQIVVVSDHSDYAYTTEALNDLFSPIFGTELDVQQATETKSGAINFVSDSSLDSEEYILEVTPTQINITSSTPQGAFYAVQSLRQTLALDALNGEPVRSIEVPLCKIEDNPHFPYRGMMFDVSRHFYTADQVKRVIDILAVHKINTLHWHLTDDQGWRIEIKKYPKLTEIGGVRSQTKIGHHSDVEAGYNGTPYGPYFYTHEEIKDVVAYAKSRFITVIPEIELPGHGIAAMTAYPHLGCAGKDYEVRTRWGIADSVFCAGKETTYKFWEDVLSEVVELFPSEYIHIGGDECPKTEWKKCPACQARIKSEGLKDEMELQGYVTNRIEKFLNSKGRKMIGWDEILDAGTISQTATVMSWQGTRGGIAAAKQGNYVIMTPTTYCYFDYYQNKDTENEPLAIGGYLPLEKVYELDPYLELNEDQQKYILGVQANVWTEYINTPSHLEYMLLPRLSAIAERGWSYNNSDYADFFNRMNNLTTLYDYEGYNYSSQVFDTEK